MDRRLQKADRPIEGHRLDVEGAEDRLLVDEVAVIDVRLSSRQDDAHIAHVYVDCAQVGSVQRRPLADEISVGQTKIGHRAKNILLIFRNVQTVYML